jgi:uncharacterized protein (DUF885 family)
MVRRTERSNIVSTPAPPPASLATAPASGTSRAGLGATGSAKTPMAARASHQGVAHELSGAMGAGVQAMSAVTPVAPPGPAALAKLVDAYWEDYLALDPITASSIGDKRYNDRFPNYASPEFADASRAMEQKYLTAAKAIDRNALDAASQITYDVFVNDRSSAIAALRFPGHMLPFNQLDSWASNFAVMGAGTSVHPFDTPKDYDDFAKRCIDFVTWIESAITSMRAGIASGITFPKVAIAQAIPQLHDIAAGGKAEKSTLWGSITELKDKKFPAAEKKRITKQYKDVLEKLLLPAYTKLADFLEKEYVPAARDSVAWTAMPEGKAWYAERVQNQTTTAMGPEEIFREGVKQVANIRSEMEAVKNEVGFKGDLHAFFQYVQTDEKFYYATGAQLVDGYRALKKDIDARLSKLFAWTPKHDYEIREVEPFRAASSSGAFYESGSEDGSRPGIFYVNTFNLKAQPKFGMETLSLHEAAPGHHFQISAAQENKELPRFRRFNGYVAYQEGWALYSEALGKELGLYTDPYAWYGHLSDGMLRAMRLVVDTGLHAKGWTRQQAIDYMLDNSSMAKSDVEAEVDRYIVTPAQALGYKIGELRIRAARTRAEKALGTAFDVKAFHNEMIRDGALPLEVLDRKLDAWIAGQSAKA